MHEKLRRFFEHVDASSAHAWEYWKKIPPIQMGDYVVKHTEEVVKSLTTGDSDIRKRCVELAFVAFALSEKYAEIMNVIVPTIKASTAKEVQGDTADQEAEKREKAEWYKKRGKPLKGEESWRG